MTNQVAIVGGGPAGLWTAALIKAQADIDQANTNKAQADVDVTVYEKYNDYKRIHSLILKHSAMNGAPNDPRIQKVLDQFRKTKPSGPFFSRQSTISTREIEKSLYELCNELGVKVIKNQPITDLKTLKENHPNLKVVIGADGAHSFVRGAVFEDGASSYRLHLNTVVELKYQVKGSAFRLLKSKAVIETSELVQQYVGGVDRHGNTPVTIRIFASNKDYDALAGATFKNPYTLDQAPDGVKETLQKMLDLRAKSLGEKRIEGSEKLTALPLKTYTSRSFVKKIEGVWYALVGDCAFGVPYFRGMNNAFICSISLANRVSNALNNPGWQRYNFWVYNASMHLRATWEVVAASIKNIAINILRLIIWITSFPIYPIKKAYWYFTADQAPQRSLPLRS